MLKNVHVSKVTAATPTAATATKEVNISPDSWANDNTPDAEDSNGPGSLMAKIRAKKAPSSNAELIRL